MPGEGTVERAMYTLYKDMNEEFGDDGCDLTLSENMGYAVQAHHCISCSVIQELHSRDLARLAVDSDYDINNGNNGVALPAYFGHMKHDDRQRHRGGHWDDYYDAVADELNPLYEKYKKTDPCKDATARKNIKAALEAVENRIKKRLLKPSLWLYEWSEKLYNADYRDEGCGNMRAAGDRDGSSSSGLEWIATYGSTIKRRHALSGGRPALLTDWYTKKYGYPAPGGLK